MNRDELKLYLERIGLADVPAADGAGLAAVQHAHLATVPFENLDVTAGRLPLALDEAALFDKVVTRKRGGICYELNLLFAAALRAMGFEVLLKGGRHPKYGDDMDHLFLLVRTPGSPGSEEPWIADVGFAANFATPLRLVLDEQQNDGIDRYLVERAPDVGDGYLRLSRIPGLSGDAESQELFAFGPAAYEPADCRQRCDWFCTAAESRFTQGPLVTLQEPDGRITLSGNHFIETCAGQKTSTDVSSQEEFDRYLHERFGLTR